MENDEANASNDKGKETPDNSKDDTQPISDYDKALALVTRREEVCKVELDIIKQKKELATNEMLGGNTGGHIEPKMVSVEDKAKTQASEFFKGTALGDAIDKT